MYLNVHSTSISVIVSEWYINIYMGKYYFIVLWWSIIGDFHRLEQARNDHVKTVLALWSNRHQTHFMKLVHKSSGHTHAVQPVWCLSVLTVVIIDYRVFCFVFRRMQIELSTFGSLPAAWSIMNSHIAAAYNSGLMLSIVNIKNSVKRWTLIRDN